MKTKFLTLTTLLFLAACQPSDNPAESRETPPPSGTSTVNLTVVDQIERQLATGLTPTYATDMDAAGAEFVIMALKMGQFDKDYVDAYYGPQTWRELADTSAIDPESFQIDLNQYFKKLREMEVAPENKVRHQMLVKLTRAMIRRFRVVQQKPVTFDQEVRFIYDVKPRTYDLSDYDSVLAEIDALLPGDAPLHERVTSYKDSLSIPKDKLKPVFDRAIEECRTRTQVYFDLPETEKFRMEFVTDKSWSGYNYYQGGYESLIQINTDFPISISRAVDLGCHEGYPGHHVWNLFIEKELLGERGWIEYSVNPLFGPFGPIAEGSANYGINLAIPGDEKIKFEQEVLYPMAGLDPMQAEKLDKLNALTSKLSHATNVIAKAYLDGELEREDAITQMQKYYLQSREKSEQRIRFVEKYRGYVINYNIGKDLVAEYIKSNSSSDADRWAAFETILTTPLTASDMQ